MLSRFEQSPIQWARNNLPIIGMAGALTLSAACGGSHQKPEVRISDDGCEITAAHASGLYLEVGASTPTKGGGTGPNPIPKSGDLTMFSGGFEGMTSYGRISDSSNKEIAVAATLIEAQSCPGS